MSEQTSINSGDILLNQQKIGELETLVNDMIISHAYIVGRLHQLEEKERERARDEHERDVSE